MPHVPQTLQLRGRNALSEFRLKKLRAALHPAALDLTSVHAEFWHFVRTARPLTQSESWILERILTYGPSSEPAPEVGQLLLVVPRMGTISPWSSKATDIAHQCGLTMVERIERGTAWHVAAGGAHLSATQQATLLPHVHDRMIETVLGDFGAAEQMFLHYPPQPFKTINLREQGTPALEQANQSMGLALSADEIDYLAQHFSKLRRDPTDVELMMFAQANSEHCRHKIFNAAWIIDGVTQSKSLFAMIRNTHELHPAKTIVAYSDNAAIIEGPRVARFFSASGGGYGYTEDDVHAVIKVETHNHPTAISPFPGAATGAGGEIRDEGATGRGAKPQAGLTGFSVSNLYIPDCIQPWEHAEQADSRPAHIASALQIMIEGPIGGAAFNNEFGRPNLCGYFRTYEQEVAGEVRGYHKPIMIAGGVGGISGEHAHKHALSTGALLIQLGGPGMAIGLGGGAASSMQTGANAQELDFASVQRGNAEMERRAQEVIDRCWALGAQNPILSIHDVGAGGLSNALPEIIHASQLGGHINLRAIPSEEPGMSPLQIWCNESQERYVLAVAAEHLSVFVAICERERCPFAVVGTATPDQRLLVADSALNNDPVDMELPVLLGKPPKMLRAVAHRSLALPSFDTVKIALGEAALRVLQLPAVADKTFLITIGDRTVGGMTARDQMVGPWQVPVADVAVTAWGFKETRGEAMTMGERTPLALINPAASGRMAIGEAITNLAAALIADIGDVKLSANWMAAAGHPGEDAALYDTVRAVGMEFCPQLGISIPVGKDSMSMKTGWTQGGQSKEVTAPLSLIVSAFAPVTDVRKTLTPQLRTDCGASDLILVDLGLGACRMGGSALAQVYNEIGDSAPDAEDPVLLRAFFAAIQYLNAQDKLLAYHDRSDGGLFATLCEMMFAGRCGIELESPLLDRSPITALFNEELGAVLQVLKTDSADVLHVLGDYGLGKAASVIGRVAAHDQLVVKSSQGEIYRADRIDLHRAWSQTTYHMQKLRDHPECAQQEYDRILDKSDPGISAHLTFDPNEDVAAPYINRGARPRMAILREQGVNGQIEMAAAFDRAGFDTVDVHMSDIIAGRVSLRDFKGFAACGGFSYGDVLGAGEGWAKSILFNPRARQEFEAFFARIDTFALGVCNGCQMMSALREIIPGTATWPRFVRNKAEQFEARFTMVEVPESPSIFFAGMAGSRLPIAVAHGEGYAEFADRERYNAAQALVTLRFIDNHGVVTEKYPYNPNGSPGGVTGLTTPDGRYTILMPHPERVFRTLQNSWHPADWKEDGPWLRLFRNARKRVG